MPDLLAHLDPQQRMQAAKAITHFLAKTYENDFEFQKPDPAAVTRGEKVFGSVGCIACHSPRDQKAMEQLMANSKPLGHIAQKYNVNGLVEFLENPLAVRPSGRMPSMQLTHAEAVDVASFLLQEGDPPLGKIESNDELFN